MSTDRVLAQCDTILELIEEEVPEDALSRASDFFEGVKERVSDMQETISRTRTTTPKQRSALDNMEAAVRKWIHE